MNEFRFTWAKNISSEEEKNNSILKFCSTLSYSQLSSAFTIPRRKNNSFVEGLWITHSYKSCVKIHWGKLKYKQFLTSKVLPLGAHNHKVQRSLQFLGIGMENATIIQVNLSVYNWKAISVKQYFSNNLQHNYYPTPVVGSRERAL